MDDLTRRRLVDMLPRLRRFAYAMCGNLHDADDLVQLGGERAIGNFDRWRRGTSLESWLFAIVRNAYLDLYRGRQVRSTHAQAVRDTSAQAIDGTRLAEDGVMVSHVLGCLAELPEDHRAALILALVEGLTYQEIAELQHVPVGTVTSRIGRARQVLRQALNEGDASEQGDADRVHVHQ